MSDSKTFQDDILETAHLRAREIVDETVKMYPRPPGLRKLTEREQLDQYMSMTPQKMQELMQRKGDVATNYYISTMEALKKKKLGA